MMIQRFPRILSLREVSVLQPRSAFRAAFSVTNTRFLTGSAVTDDAAITTATAANTPGGHYTAIRRHPPHPYPRSCMAFPLVLQRCTKTGQSLLDDDRKWFTAATRPALATTGSSPFDPERQNTKKSPFAGDGTLEEKPNQQQQRKRRRRRKEFVPRKAAVELTERARLFFKQLLSNPPRKEIIGALLNYDQSTTGEPRMVFSFSFVTAEDLERMSHAHGNAMAEGVSLEVVEEPIVLRGGGKETTKTRIVPKTPAESKDDGLPKLYVSGNAFLKVLGATVDVDPEGDLTPILYDKQGNRMDPNA